MYPSQDDGERLRRSGQGLWQEFVIGRPAQSGVRLHDCSEGEATVSRGDSAREEGCHRRDLGGAQDIRRLMGS